MQSYKKRLQHRCFLVNIEEFLRTLFWTIFVNSCSSSQVVCPEIATNASTFYRCSSPKIHLYIKGGQTSQSTSVNTANVLLQENKRPIHNGIAVSGIWEIVYQFHYRIAKLTERYRIPRSMILNSGQLPQCTSLLGEQQYHQKTQSCHSCWLNRLASKHTQSILTE